MFDGEARFGPRVENPGLGEPLIGQLLHALPQEAVLLAAAPKRAEPEADDVGPEGPQCRIVGRHLYGVSDVKLYCAFISLFDP